MNYTEKYHLPQWAKEDRIMMEDFNRMCAGIESGMSANAQAAAEAAELPYVVGSYVGNGSTQNIRLGFRPSVVLVCADQTASTAGGCGQGFLMVGPTVAPPFFSITDDGFQVVHDGKLPHINWNQRPYDYIAFR